MSLYSRYIQPIVKSISKRFEKPQLFPIDINHYLPVTSEPLTIRQKIEWLEEKVGAIAQVELPLTHHFSKGIYAREMFIPKGTVVVGKIHKYEHLNICSKGTITVLTEDGVKTITAPFMMNCRPGTKRVGYAHEDTIWTTIHSSNETDLTLLEEELISKTYDDVDLIEEMKKLREAI